MISVVFLPVYIAAVKRNKLAKRLVSLVFVLDS